MTDKSVRDCPVIGRLSAISTILMPTICSDHLLIYLLDKSSSFIKMTQESNIKMVGFRRMQVVMGEDHPKAMSFQQPKLNVVLVDIGGTEAERIKLIRC